MQTTALVMLAEPPPEPAEYLLRALCDQLTTDGVQLVEAVSPLPDGTPEALVEHEDVRLCVAVRRSRFLGAGLVIVECHAPWTAPPGVCTDELLVPDTNARRYVMRSVRAALEQRFGAEQIRWFERGQVMAYLARLAANREEDGPITNEARSATRRPER